MTFTVNQWIYNCLIILCLFTKKSLMFIAFCSLTILRVGVTLLVILCTHPGYSADHKLDVEHHYIELICKVMILYKSIKDFIPEVEGTSNNHQFLRLLKFSKKHNLIILYFCVSPWCSRFVGLRTNWWNWVDTRIRWWRRGMYGNWWIKDPNTFKRSFLLTHDRSMRSRSVSVTSCELQ